MCALTLTFMNGQLPDAHEPSSNTYRPRYRQARTGDKTSTKVHQTRVLIAAHPLVPPRAALARAP